jgi:hypothetical protein
MIFPSSGCSYVSIIFVLGTHIVEFFIWDVETLELSIKSCPIGPELHPSFDASFTFGCCWQSHEILLNKGMKYWDLALNAPGLRTFIVTVHIAWLVETAQEEKRQGKLSLAPVMLQLCCKYLYTIVVYRALYYFKTCWNFYSNKVITELFFVMESASLLEYLRTCYLLKWIFKIK